MKCPSCGTEDLSGLYCSNCGNRIPLNKEDNYTKADNETNELNCNNVTVPIKKSKTKFKKSEILSLVVLFIIIGITIFSISINYYLALSEKEENYKKCIQLVRENKWKDTSLAMYVIQKENYRDSKIIYSSDSSIFQVGFGLEAKLLWIINSYFGFGYALFDKKLPVVDHFEIQNNDDAPQAVFKTQYLNGLYGFGGFGIEYPINDDYDIFIRLNFDIYEISNLGDWNRMSIISGFSYEL